MAMTQEERDAEDLATLTVELLALPAKLRKEYETKGFTLPNGFFVPTDEKTERRIIGAYAKAQADSNYTIADWSVDGGQTYTTLTAPEILAIGSAADAYIQKCFSTEKLVKNASYATAAEIEAAFAAAMEA